MAKVMPDAFASVLAEYDARFDALRVAFTATPRQSDAARLLGVNGKVLRDNTRKHGHYVSRGAVWDAALAGAMWETPYIQHAVVARIGARPTPPDADTPDAPDAPAQ